MTIRHLAHGLAHNFIGGLGGLSDFMQIGKQALTNKLNYNSDSHHLYIQELEQLADLTNTNQAVAEYFADKCNAIVVKLPEINDLGDMGLLDKFLQIMQELGKLSAEFQKAYADGDIDQKEFAKIRLEVAAVTAKLLEWQAAIERVVR